MCDTDTTTVNAIAASTLRTAVNELQRNSPYSMCDAFNVELKWRSHLRDLGIPLCFSWNSEAEPPSKIPESVLSQLEGQKIGSGIRFTHEGKECWVVECDFTESRLGETISVGDVSTITNLSGVETRYIDMDA